MNEVQSTTFLSNKFQLHLDNQNYIIIVCRAKLFQISDSLNETNKVHDNFLWRRKNHLLSIFSLHVRLNET